MDATLPLALPLTLFALGLASGLHCLGMCGGIVTAFSTTRVLQPRARLLPNQLLFNAGRIASYSAAGLVAGATGALFHGSSVLYIAVNVLLVFVGLHLVGLRTPLQWLERLG